MLKWFAGAGPELAAGGLENPVQTAHTALTTWATRLHGAQAPNQHKDLAQNLAAFLSFKYFDRIASDWATSAKITAEIQCIAWSYFFSLLPVYFHNKDICCSAIAKLVPFSAIWVPICHSGTDFLMVKGEEPECLLITRSTAQQIQAGVPAMLTPQVLNEPINLSRLQSGVTSALCYQSNLLLSATQTDTSCFLNN